MLSRIRDTGIARRVLAIGPGFFDSFLRDNKVIPPVLAVLALLIFSWVVAGIFVGKPEEERVANQANVVAQAPDNSNDSGSDSPAPQVESRDADSYAAYESKDPFRQLFAPAESTNPTQETTGGSGGSTPPENTTGSGGGNSGGSTTGGGGENTSGGGGGSSRGFQDSDNDGLSNRREQALGQDPQNPDTDGDGTLDGADDSNGDGIPDGQSRTTGGNGGGNGGGGGTTTGKGNGGLFNSGGSLP